MLFYKFDETYNFYHSVELYYKINLQLSLLRLHIISSRLILMYNLNRL